VGGGRGQKWPPWGSLSLYRHIWKSAIKSFCVKLLSKALRNLNWHVASKSEHLIQRTFLVYIYLCLAPRVKKAPFSRSLYYTELSSMFNEGPSVR
jgi:hypothetical protein